MHAAHVVMHCFRTVHRNSHMDLSETHEFLREIGEASAVGID